MKKMNIGIAGYGKMGKIRERSFMQSNKANLVAIFDTNNQSENKSIIFCKNYHELLNTNIEAVFISAFANTAAEFVVAALKAGKHVFCEKPPAMNFSDLQKVIKQESASQYILKYGFNHRMHYSVMQAKELIDSGSMGNILWMRGVYGKAGSIDFNTNWRNYKKYSGGGILIDQGIHMLDLFRYFAKDEFNLLSSHLSTSFWKIESEDNAFITLKSGQGIIATLHSTANQWKHKFLLEIALEKGYITLDGILSSTGSYGPEKLIYGFREFEDVTKAMGKPTEYVSYYEYDDSWKFELDEFINAIKGISKIEHGTIKDAIEIMKLIDKIYDNKK